MQLKWCILYCFLSLCSLFRKYEQYVVCLDDKIHLLECCTLFNSSINVNECLNKHYLQRQLIYENQQIVDIQNLTSKYNVVTYSTNNILDYSLYSFAINSAYLQFRNSFSNSIEKFKIFSTSSQSGFEFESRDQRWNKVNILKELLMQMIDNSSIIDIQYVIWMDSDLVVIDFDFDFEDLVAEYPNADILISKEAYPENGMVNTGCMIIRKSQWSISFLTEWWVKIDHISAMDQHVFDIVYKQRKAATDDDDIDKHIIMLDIDKINSHIPAIKYQKPENKILHLAGESSIIRMKVFETGFQTICKAANLNENNLYFDGLNINILPAQLGLTKQWLNELDYYSTLHKDLLVTLNKMQSCAANSDIAKALLAQGQLVTTPIIDVSCAEGEVGMLQNSLRDTMQSRSRVHHNNSGHNASNSGFEDPIDSHYMQLRVLYVLGLRWLFDRYLESYQVFLRTVSVTSAIYSTSEEISNLQLELNHLQNVADAGFDLCVAETNNWEKLHDSLQLLEPIVNRIIALTIADTKTLQGHDDLQIIHRSSIGVALYYKFKYLEFSARYYYHSNRLEESLQVLCKAMEVWYRMSNEYHYYGPGNAVANTHSEINDLIQLKQHLLMTIRMGVEEMTVMAEEDSPTVAALSSLEEGIIATATIKAIHKKKLKKLKRIK